VLVHARGLARDRGGASGVVDEFELEKLIGETVGQHLPDLPTTVFAAPAAG